MKNKVVSLFLKIYKKFFRKKIQTQKTPSEQNNLQHNKELQNQIKQKENQAEVIFPETANSSNSPPNKAPKPLSPKL